MKIFWYVCSRQGSLQIRDNVSNNHAEDSFWQSENCTIFLLDEEKAYSNYANNDDDLKESIQHLMFIDSPAKFWHSLNITSTRRDAYLLAEWKYFQQIFLIVATNSRMLTSPHWTKRCDPLMAYWNSEDGCAARYQAKSCDCIAIHNVK